MDIHKPKPWHGAREFLKEYGIIVLGVVTALALEQAVEALHWRHVVQETRTGLQDSAQSMYFSMLTRVDIQDCVDRRLADIGTILQRHDAGQPLGITGPIGAPTEDIADLSAFDMAIADQALSHMSIAEQGRYFGIVGSYRVFQKAADPENQAWQTLQGLNRTKTFAASDWADVRKAYDVAKTFNAILKNDLRDDRDGYWLTPFKGFAKPKDSSLRFIPHVKQLCQSAIATR